MIKKKLLAIMLGTALLLTACSAEGSTPQSSTNSDNTQNSDKFSIVATSFHEYDWVRNIIGENNENISVTLLMDNGMDLHSYEPSVEDISVISSADLFIYNGGLSQDWIADIIVNPMNKSQKTLNVIESLGDAVKMEVLVEGMQSGGHDHAEDEHDHEEDEHDHAEDEHDHANEHEDEHDHEEDEHDHEEDEHDHEEDEHDHANEHEDEHVWLSLNNAVLICAMIEEEISKLDSENADMYQTNLNNYVKSLEELDSMFKDTIESAPRDTLVFADRFPFLYLMQDYDVHYYAAFQGCSAETEASFETIAFLTEKVNELDINTLLIIEDGLMSLAETVNNNSEDKDCQILELNSIQSVSNKELEENITYYSIMEENLEVLSKALSEE